MKWTRFFYIFLLSLFFLLSSSAYADYILTNEQMNELKLNLKILKDSQNEQSLKLQKAQSELEKSKMELAQSLKISMQLENKSNQLQKELTEHEKTIAQQQKLSAELKKSLTRQRKSRNFWRGLSLISAIAFMLK